MITRFGTGTDVPDMFFLNAEYTPEWIEEGFLYPLDDYIAAQGFDTSTFFAGYADTFKGADGKTYGLAKDGNTIAMAYNTDLVTTSAEDARRARHAGDGLKGQGSLKAPICVNPALDRGLGFIYAQGGELLTEDGSASAIETDESKAAVQWYLDLFKNGLAQTDTQLGDGWCGEALGKGDVAITFEGGWLLGYMNDDLPRHQLGLCRDADRQHRREGHDLATPPPTPSASTARTRTRVDPPPVPRRAGRHGQVDRRRDRHPVAERRRRSRRASSHRRGRRVRPAGLRLHVGLR